MKPQTLNDLIEEENQKDMDVDQNPNESEVDDEATTASFSSPRPRVAADTSGTDLTSKRTALAKKDAPTVRAALKAGPQPADDVADRMDVDTDSNESQPKPQQITRIQNKILWTTRRDPQRHEMHTIGITDADQVMVNALPSDEQELFAACNQSVTAGENHFPLLDIVTTQMLYDVNVRPKSYPPNWPPPDAQICKEQMLLTDVENETNKSRWARMAAMGETLAQLGGVRKIICDTIQPPAKKAAQPNVSDRKVVAAPERPHTASNSSAQVVLPAHHVSQPVVPDFSLSPMARRSTQQLPTGNNIAQPSISIQAAQPAPYRPMSNYYAQPPLMFQQQQVAADMSAPPGLPAPRRQITIKDYNLLGQMIRAKLPNAITLAQLKTRTVQEQIQNILNIGEANYGLDNVIHVLLEHFEDDARQKFEAFYDQPSNEFVMTRAQFLETLANAGDPTLDWKKAVDTANRIGRTNWKGFIGDIPDQLHAIANNMRRCRQRLSNDVVEFLRKTEPAYVIEDIDGYILQRFSQSLESNIALRVEINGVMDRIRDPNDAYTLDNLTMDLSSIVFKQKRVPLSQANTINAITSAQSPGALQQPGGRHPPRQQQQRPSYGQPGQSYRGGRQQPFRQSRHAPMRRQSGRRGGFSTDRRNVGTPQRGEGCYHCRRHGHHAYECTTRAARDQQILNMWRDSRAAAAQAYAGSKGISSEDAWKLSDSTIGWTPQHPPNYSPIRPQDGRRIASRLRSRGLFSYTVDFRYFEMRELARISGQALPQAPTCIQSMNQLDSQWESIKTEFIAWYDRQPPEVLTTPKDKDFNRYRRRDNRGPPPPPSSSIAAIVPNGHIPETVIPIASIVPQPTDGQRAIMCKPGELVYEWTTAEETNEPVLTLIDSGAGVSAVAREFFTGHSDKLSRAVKRNGASFNVPGNKELQLDTKLALTITNPQTGHSYPMDNPILCSLPQKRIAGVDEMDHRGYRIFKFDQVFDPVKGRSVLAPDVEQWISLLLEAINKKIPAPPLSFLSTIASLTSDASDNTTIASFDASDNTTIASADASDNISVSSFATTATDVTRSSNFPLAPLTFSDLNGVQIFDHTPSADYMTMDLGKTEDGIDIIDQIGVSQDDIYREWYARRLDDLGDKQTNGCNAQSDEDDLKDTY